MNNQQTNDKGIFSVMTINLRFGLADDGPNRWEVRKNSYAPLFHAYQPDFINMQEANDFQTDYFQKILPSYQFIGKRKSSPSYWQNNIIFFKSNWKCESYDRFYLSDTPSVPSRQSKSKWPRQCVIGKFNNDDASLICANTHFDFNESVQVKSAQIILERLAGYPSHLPVVISGDFNASPNSACYKSFVSNHHDRNNFNEIFQGEYSCTHHAFTGGCTGKHIDWILYQGDMSIKQREIVHDRFNGHYPSDHFPVYAVFKLSV